MYIRTTVDMKTQPYDIEDAVQQKANDSDLNGMSQMILSVNIKYGCEHTAFT